MESFVATLAIAGAIALLLWGAHMVQSGVQRAFGPRLRAVLTGTLRNRFAALLAGIGVTTLLQSSTATALMATNFTAAGLVELVPAMAVMLGANIGTALIVTVLSFNVVVLSAPLIAGGVLLFRLDRSAMSHDLGRVLIGLGLMLLALHQLLEALEPMASSAEVVALLGLLGAMPLLAVLLGALASWAVHSSVAVVLLIISLASHGVVGFESALLLVLGANLGTALNPLFEAGDGDPAARRLPLANLFNRLVGVAIAWVALAPIVTLLRGTGLGEGTSLALFHLGFNIVMALLALPFLRQIAALMTRLVPDREDTADPARPIYLDHAALETPMMALGGAQREALRLADALEAMLTGARDALVRHDRRLVAETRAMDDTLDGLNTAIKRYLALFDEDDLSDEDRQKLHQIMVFSMNMEQAGDVLDRNLLPHATKRFKRGLLPDADSEVELVAMMDRLIANTRMAASLFVTEDANVARILAAEKVVFRRAEQNGTTRHFSHMRDGFSAASQSSALHLDLMRDMKLVNSFIVAAAAYPLLDKAGELLESRLASSAE
ncbi:Na/Pi cotransporter family protein [Devosia sp. ZB163]|uniref:Na/Pi cotransporter family protein n=1 Tax=Devosia sp. ZB163 TaxID=3025938 RepID=UPI002361787D|nr:Na/Pi cotransporter family protein [Devosia sp. ZB163]MDC9825693.1 Na/Pi cotransporter family protein [Devosia sp. ZB163]